MGFEWPQGVSQIPDEEWATRPLESLALKYDTVEHHGWYSNLDLSVEQLQDFLKPGQLLLDYSGGTGILSERLMKAMPDASIGVLIADSSPKFLRLAVEKLGVSPAVAFRLIAYVREERRLKLIDEILDPPLLERGVDAIVSTNAIHLYYQLEETLRSWRRVLSPGGRVFAQSGNIRHPAASEGDWIIDETVGAIHRTAVEIVGSDARFAAYRSVLEDGERLGAYESLRNKFFLPVRPLAYYTQAFDAAGLSVSDVSYRVIEARVDEWLDFVSVYHEGVLGWVGGSERIEGKAPTEEAVADRLRLIRLAMERLFEGRETFPAGWTYLSCDPI